MTKNLHEPSTSREVAANRYGGKMTQQKPYAYEWVTPVNDADCSTAQADPVTYWTPCYLNDWEQPTTLEPLSVRISADGNLQWQGYVNSQNATSAIAFIMPGTWSFEPDMIPDFSVAENLSYNVFVTPDDGGTITQGRAYVDSTTGEVSITTGSGAYFRAYFYDNPIIDLSGTSRWVDWNAGEWEVGGVPGVFTPKTPAGATATSTDKVRKIWLNEPGRIEICFGYSYTLTGDAANGDVYSHFLQDENVILGNVFQDTHAAPSGVEAAGYLTSNYSRIYPQLDPFSSGAYTPKFGFLISWSGPTTGEDMTEGFVDIYWRPLA